MLAPITAAGTLRSAGSENGREAQSTAFFSTPGIEALYSGVANSRASASRIAARQRLDRRAGRRLVVLVERRQRLQPVELDELDRGRQQVGRRPQELAVVRGAAQRSCDSEHSHRAQPWISSSSTVSLTSLASAKPPFGSGAFQFRPNFVRSIVVSRVRPRPVLPAMFSCGPAISPRAMTGWVLPLIVSSPSTRDGVAVAADARRAERELRVLLDVEEVRRAEVALQVLVLDDDRAGVDGADELGAVLGDGERGVEVTRSGRGRWRRPCA